MARDFGSGRESARRANRLTLLIISGKCKVNPAHLYRMKSLIWDRLFGALKKPLYFLHINKTGGTTLREVGFGPNYKTNSPRLIRQRHQLLLDYRFVWVKHEHAPTVFLNSSPLAFIIRNPTSRLESCFKAYKNKSQLFYNKLPTKHHEHPLITSHENFSDFINSAIISESRLHKETIAALNGNTSLPHFNMNYAYFFKNPETIEIKRKNILFIGTQENLNEDVNTLLNNIGFNGGIELPKINSNSSVNQPNSEHENFLKSLIPNEFAIYDKLLSIRHSILKNSRK